MKPTAANQPMTKPQILVAIAASVSLCLSMVACGPNFKVKESFQSTGKLEVKKDLLPNPADPTQVAAVAGIFSLKSASITSPIVDEMGKTQGYSAKILVQDESSTVTVTTGEVVGNALNRSQSTQGTMDNITYEISTLCTVADCQQMVVFAKRTATVDGKQVVKQSAAKYSYSTNFANTVVQGPFSDRGYADINQAASGLATEGFGY
jgi:hypothetical protein